MEDQLLETLIANYGPGIIICSPTPSDNDSEGAPAVVVLFRDTNGMRFLLRHRLLLEDVLPSEDEGWERYLRDDRPDEGQRPENEEPPFVPSVYALLFGTEVDAYAAILPEEPPANFVPQFDELGPPTYWLRLLLSNPVTAESVTKPEDYLLRLLAPVFEKFRALQHPTFRTLCLGEPKSFFGCPARIIGRAHFDDVDMNVLEVTVG
jgi:hypothetical protein